MKVWMGCAIRSPRLGGSGQPLVIWRRRWLIWQLKSWGWTLFPARTEDTPTYGGYVGPFADFLGRVKVKYSAFPPTLIMHLAENYGNHLDDVQEVAMEPDALAPLAEGHADIEAQVRYAARHEMALTVEDVLFRRTGLGTLGMPGEATIERVADVMAHELAWDGAERTAQIARAKAAFLPWVEL